MEQYAIIKSGGKQYSVKTGDVIDVELLEGDKGSQVEFADILFFHDGKEGSIGAPVVANAKVKAQVVDQVRGPKEISYKYKKRKNYRRKIGHRQYHTRVKITELAAG